MKILYIYPHPDDESFGPAHVMHKQIRDGHEVYLLTLTKGGATKQRFKYNLSIDEMGEVRYKEMLDVKKTLNLTDMNVLDLPDSGLKEMDPRDIENVIEKEIIRVEPNVIVTYPVHGISGFHDHLITHAIVKRVYVELKEKLSYLKRLAFITLKKEEAEKGKHFTLSGSTEDEIDCIIKVEAEDIEAAHKALDCYKTFQETIEKSGIKNFILEESCFEIFGENFNPPINDLFNSFESN
ncbi:MAG: PIG-L family deacetylase [Ignavibacteriae bacterium]|nr:PIG-L family deacetylase [Ignavibacteriota bacterium]NOG99042.1 PIG-L family deacetylase [Ignavibacteriota bacterium]